MGYSGPHSFGARILSEFLSTFFLMALGLTIIANDTLPTTTGHKMGPGFVSLGFGFCFSFALTLFQDVSAYMNPGDLNGWEFFTFSIVEITAGIAAGLIVWIVFWMHIVRGNVIDEEADIEDGTTLLKADADIESNETIDVESSEQYGKQTASVTVEDLANAKTSPSATTSNRLSTSTSGTHTTKKHSPTKNSRQPIPNPQISPRTILLLFATSPPPPSSLLHSFFLEVLGSCTLTLVSPLISTRIPSTEPTVHSIILPILQGIFFMVLVMGLGGPTGFAANPARDLGPRIAHSLLVEREKKGTRGSEWGYGVLANSGVMVGGALGGLIGVGLRSMSVF
ncbi:hypothetical protein HDU97_006832 [Phlyctochytrium planicorne]|nr:hypothetical protein HDU97_006832 [Phlyctochytrium planicorne]